MVMYVQNQVWRSRRDEENRDKSNQARDSKRSPSLGRAHTTAATPRRQIPLEPLEDTN